MPNGAVKKRVQFTDLSNSPCAFSEAPAETVFSIYSRVTQGREAFSICKAVALTRVALHEPPVATSSSKDFTKSSMWTHLNQSMALDFVLKCGLREPNHLH